MFWIWTLFPGSSVCDSKPHPVTVRGRISSAWFLCSWFSFLQPQCFCLQSFSWETQFVTLPTLLRSASQCLLPSRIVPWLCLSLFPIKSYKQSDCCENIIQQALKQQKLFSQSIGAFSKCITVLDKWLIRQDSYCLFFKTMFFLYVLLKGQIHKSFFREDAGECYRE